MLLPAATLLRDGGEEKARTNLILRFFLAADHLLCSDGDAVRSTALETVIRLSGGALAEHASSFLYHVAYHLYEAVEAQEMCAPLAVRRFLTHLFDSFYYLLREGDSVTLSLPSDMNLLLPKLRISEHVPGPKRVSLSKRDSTAVLRDEDAGIEIGAFRVGEPCVSSILPVAPGSALLLSLESCLDDRAATGQIADFSHEEAARFVQELRAALNFIGLADRELLASIHERVHWYFPIKTPDKTSVHNSFTINTLPGAIFLSESYSYVNLAEALVHEFYHNELSWAMMIEPHVRPGDQARLYSPWRKDPRPLYGLYHGIYVFAGLLEFLTSALESRELVQHHAHCRARREEIYFQARTALAQVPQGDLTKTGMEILKGLELIIESHGQRLGLTNRPLPNAQRKHWEEWMLKNPPFQVNVVVPPGILHQEEKSWQKA